MAVSALRSMKLPVLRVVVYKEDGLWVGQCLEHDIVACALTVPQLRKELHLAVMANIAIANDLGRKPFDGIEPAPQRFFEMYDQAETSLDEAFPIEPEKSATKLRPQMRLFEREAA